jgi:Na+/melibiose symporter-like transporter
LVVFLSPLVGKIGKKIGNKNTLLITIALSAGGFCIFRFLPLTMFSVWGILIACGIGVAGFFVISYAMVYDVADVAELKTGVNNEGVIVSFFSFAIKLATAVGLWLLGVLLSFYQYDPEAETSNQVLNGIKDIGTIIPAVICGVSFLFILKYSLTPKNMSILRDLKKQKDDGQEIDKTVVHKLL